MKYSDYMAQNPGATPASFITTGAHRRDDSLLSPRTANTLSLIGGSLTDFGVAYVKNSQHKNNYGDIVDAQTKELASQSKLLSQSSNGMFDALNWETKSTQVDTRIMFEQAKLMQIRLDGEKHSLELEQAYNKAQGTNAVIAAAQGRSSADGSVAGLRSAATYQLNWNTDYAKLSNEINQNGVKANIASLQSEKLSYDTNAKLANIQSDFSKQQSEISVGYVPVSSGDAGKWSNVAAGMSALSQIGSALYGTK